ncbi:PucR family transcriptional regulator [Nocardia sp. NPDC004068]|uniref:PucR family transcriptional regulator n=1 Tax=Nocardia sp. NPDC004068 TaxID=3364303 RepID=UPI00368C9822
MFDSTTDHLDRSPRGAVAVAERPVPAVSGDAQDVARTLVGELLARVAAETSRPGDPDRDCLRLAIEIVHTSSARDRAARLAAAARQWAHEGVSLDVVNALYAALREVLNRIGHGNSAPVRQDHDVVVAAVELVRHLIETMSPAIIGACLRQLDRADDHRHETHEGALFALRRGVPASEVRARYGVVIADHYRVLALMAHPDEPSDEEFLSRRLRHALGERTGDATLAKVSASGGTVLIPTTEAADLERLVADVGRAARVSLTATVVDAATPDLAAAIERAHELLDLAQRLGLPAGVYGFADLALEYQLTRPGPALAHLRGLLVPLDGHPELRETLRCHIAADLNRLRTGKALHVHPNTVDYRLRRIAELTGLHPHRYPDQWYLRSALVIDSFQPNTH